MKCGIKNAYQTDRLKNERKQKQYNNKNTENTTWIEREREREEPNDQTKQITRLH